ncbi:MAG: hypothetical protein H8F28_13760 [Fibrella sp.]|nr:hypothetical protein [Armatimonadota bacterium]
MTTRFRPIIAVACLIILAATTSCADKAEPVGTAGAAPGTPGASSTQTVADRIKNDPNTPTAVKEQYTRSINKPK